MKVLITNVYSYKNKGDAAIVLSILDFLKSRYKIEKVSLMSDYYEENNNYYKNIENVKPLYTLKRTQNKFKKILSLFLNIVKLIFTLPLISIMKENIFKFTKNNKTFNAYKESDIVISCGGGYMYSSTKKVSIGLYTHLLQIYVAKLLNKKVIMFPQSIGPINKNIDKKILEFVLNKVDIICPRDKQSIDYLASIGINDNVMFVPDIAFILEKKSNEDIYKKYIKNYESKTKVGMTIIDWSYFRKDGDIEIFIDEMVKSIDYLIEDLNCIVYIIPQVVLSNFDNDGIISKKIISKLKNKSNVIYIEDDLDSRELKGLYSNMDMFIGCRMHSCIFALGCNVPTIGLAYQYKTTGLFEFLGLEEYTYEIINVTADYILSSAHNIIDKGYINKVDKVYEYYNKLEEKIDMLIK